MVIFPYRAKLEMKVRFLCSEVTKRISSIILKTPPVQFNFFSSLKSLGLHKKTWTWRKLQQK